MGDLGWRESGNKFVRGRERDGGAVRDVPDVRSETLNKRVEWVCSAEVLFLNFELDIILAYKPCVTNLGVK